MTKREILSLAIKILAFYVLITSLSFFLFFIEGIKNIFSGHAIDWPELVFTFFFLVVVLTISLFFIFKSDYLAGKLYPGKKGHPSKSTFSKQDIYVLVFTVLGLYLVVTSLSQTLSQILVMLIYLVPKPDADQYQLATATHQWKWLSAPAIKLVLGAILLLRPGGVYRIITRWSK